MRKTRLRTFQMTGLGLVFGMTVLLAGCGQQGGWHMPPPVVETVAAVQRPWIIKYTTTGTLEANNKVDLNSETPGTISSILVKEGDRVGRGQVLMRLEADQQLAQVQQSVAGIQASMGGVEQQKADIQQAQARLDSATRRMNLAQSELQRFEKLYAEQFISQWELDQRRTNYDTALAAYQEAQQALSSAKARYGQAASSLSQAKASYRYNVAVAKDTVIRSPFAGVVGQKYVDVGDYVAPTEKLLTVVDPSAFKIQFDVPERYLNRLHPGTAVSATFEGLGDTDYGGKVNFIDPVIDAATRTVSVKALLPAESGLRHGMFGTVALSLGTISNAVVIPEEAVVPQGDKTFVYVVTREIYQPKAAPGKKAEPVKNRERVPVAHLREVKVGAREAGFAQISAGLAPGESVITAGLQKVSDNTQVVPKSEMSAPPASDAAPKGH